MPSRSTPPKVPGKVSETWDSTLRPRDAVPSNPPDESLKTTSPTTKSEDRRKGMLDCQGQGGVYLVKGKAKPKSS